MNNKTKTKNLIKGGIKTMKYKNKQKTIISLFLTIILIQSMLFSVTTQEIEKSGVIPQNILKETAPNKNLLTLEEKIDKLVVPDVVKKKLKDAAKLASQSQADEMIENLKKELGEIIRVKKEVKGESTIYYVYDENGKLIKKIEIGNRNGNRFLRVTDYKYDEKGKLIEEKTEVTWWNKKGEIIRSGTHTTKYEYDENGKLVKKTIERDIKGKHGKQLIKTTQTIEYHYNSADGKLLWTTETLKGEIHGKQVDINKITVYQYKDGKLARTIETITGKYGNDSVCISNITEYKYDDKGKKIEETTNTIGIIGGRLIESSKTVNFKYDDKGKLIGKTSKEEIKIGNRSITIERNFTYTYNEKGQLLNVHEGYHQKGRFPGWFSHDAWNLIVGM